MFLGQSGQLHEVKTKVSLIFLPYVRVSKQKLLPAILKSKKIICFISIVFQVLLRDKTHTFTYRRANIFTHTHVNHVNSLLRLGNAEKRM